MNKKQPCLYEQLKKAENYGIIGVRKCIIAFLDESGRAPTYTVMLDPEIIKKDGAYDTE